LVAIIAGSFRRLRADPSATPALDCDDF
jgi:hypothetical protein